SLHFARRFARYGSRWVTAPSRQFLACARASDPITGTTNLPAAITLPDIPAGREQTGSAALADFAALTRPGAPLFAALVVPPAWLALPLGGPAAQLPAPAL